MPAKDNDPKSRKTPTRARAKTQPDSTDGTPVPAEAAKVPARTRRKIATAEVATSDAADATPKEAPKRRRSVRRTETVTAAAGETATAIAPSPEPDAPVTSPNGSAAAFHEEVRLRAYLLYAERGYHSA